MSNSNNQSNPPSNRDYTFKQYGVDSEDFGTGKDISLQTSALMHSANNAKSR